MTADRAAETFRVLALDSAESEYGALRLVGAIATAAGSITLVALQPSLFGWMCAFVGFGISGMWIGRWLQARRMTDRADEHFLALAPSGLELSAGAARTEVGWDAVEAVRVNEDRLVLEIAHRDGDTLKIDPRYGGLGLYDLEAAVSSAWEAAKKPPA